MILHVDIVLQGNGNPPERSGYVGGLGIHESSLEVGTEVTADRLILCGDGSAH